MSHTRSLRIRTALTLLEVVAILVVGAIFLFLLFPPRLGSRPLSPRLMCGSNLKGIGTSCKIYANENQDWWPTPAFDESRVGSIDYRIAVGGGQGTTVSPNRSQESPSGPGGARELSTTRALWMLVRSGDFTVKQLICPVGGDTEDPTGQLDLYYDFTDYTNVSYGIQVPYGPANTRPRGVGENRMALAADKGPYRNASIAIPPPGLEASHPVPAGQIGKPVPEWSAFNSPNHQGEGQNVLYADGHSSFVRTPTAGADGDNIYTIALDNFNDASRFVGESPWLRSLPPFAPVDAQGQPISTTDSVIFP